MPLAEDDYEEVRKAVQPGLTYRQLPDETIGRMTYAGRAEVMLLRAIPDANTRTDPQQVYIIRLARVLLTAANLVERLPFKRRERNGPYEYVAQGLDPESAAASLRGYAYDLIGWLLNPDWPLGNSIGWLAWTSSTNALGRRGDLRLTVFPWVSPADPGIGTNLPADPGLGLPFP